MHVVTLFNVAFPDIFNVDINVVDRQTTSFIDNSIEAGILLGGNGSMLYYLIMLYSLIHLMKTSML
jgi:hypothetical protein